MSGQRSRAARCRDCSARIVFFTAQRTGRRRPFDATPVQHGQSPRPAYPIENGATAWILRDLVEDLMIRLRCDSAEAEEHARAMPWHTAHLCPQRPTGDDQQ